MFFYSTPSTPVGVLCPSRRSVRDANLKYYGTTPAPTLTFPSPTLRASGYPATTRAERAYLGFHASFLRSHRRLEAKIIELYIHTCTYMYTVYPYIQSIACTQPTVRTAREARDQEPDASDLGPANGPWEPVYVRTRCLGLGQSNDK